jgi:PAS domain S-box-containing protein
MPPKDTTLHDLRSLLEKSRNFAIYRIAVDTAHPYGGHVVMVSPSIKDVIGASDPNDYGTWFHYVHPEDIQRVLDTNHQSFVDGTPFDESLRIFNPQKDAWGWVRMLTTPVLDEEGQLTHFNGLVIDISEQKRAEELLRQQIAFENLVTNLSTKFINLKPDEIDIGISEALKTIGSFNQVDRCYVGIFSLGDRSLQISHEWCAPGIASLHARTNHQSMENLPYLIGSMQRCEIVHLPQLDMLPPEAEKDRLKATEHGIQSMLLVPMIYQQEAIGFLGFDSVKAQKTWSEESIQLLNIVGELFVNALQQKRSQAIQEGQRQFLELLATGGDFYDTLHTLVQIIEGQWPRMLGLVLLLDKDGQHLHIGAYNQLPREYIESIEGLEIGPEVGSCGTACFTKERVIVTNIAKDKRWEGLRSLALKYGLRACWSEPVINADGFVLGTFAMYYDHPRQPNKNELHAIEVAAHLVGVAIEQKSSQEELQHAYQTLETRVQERTRELQVLLDFAAATNSSLSMDPMLKTVLERLVHLIQAERVAVMLRDSMTNQLEVRAYSPDSTAKPEELLKLNLAGESVINTGELITLTNLPTPAVLLPLRTRGEVIGALGIIGPQNSTLNEDSFPLFQSIADRLAIAVENARLYQQAEINAAVTERNRLARDLHDAVTQTLFSASLIADVLPDVWQQEPAEGEKLLDEIRQLNRGALAEMRTLLLELRPKSLQEAQLENLLHQLAEASMGQLGVPVTVNIEGPCQLPPTVKIVMYRVAQEALNNIIKHAQATHVMINLFCSETAPTQCTRGLKLEVVDNGRGFDPGTVPADHLGLRIMRERVESIGGHFDIQSQLGDGTRVNVTWQPEE